MTERIPMNPDLKALIASRVEQTPLDPTRNPKLHAFTAMHELLAELKYQTHQEGIEQKANGVTFRELAEVRDVTVGAAAHQYGNQETRLRRIERSRRVRAEQRAENETPLPGVSVAQLARLQGTSTTNIYRRIQNGEGDYEVQEVTVGARRIKRIMNAEFIEAVKAA